MQVTALIPVRDGASTLSVALESLRNQTHPIYSCVVVDDGSTDSTPRLLDEWRGRWSALRVARTDGLGIARALNAGLSLSASEWIARLDADDRAHPARVERQLAAAAADSALLVGCSVRHWVEGARADAYEGMRRHVDWANARASHEELERALWVDSPLAHPSWLVHRRAFEAVGEYDESGAVPEDYDWLHRFFAASRSAGELRATKAAGEPLVDWAESDTRLTRVSSAYSEAAFNVVKARALQRLLAGRSPELFVFGLGPKAKLLFPLLREKLGEFSAIVEVHPRRIGIRYRGTEVRGVDHWREAVARARDPFVVICLGTPESRANGERLCAEAGLEPLKGFVSL